MITNLENCIASLIIQENSEPSDSSDMEQRVINMFEDLNNDAINFNNFTTPRETHIKFRSTEML